jgi:outer membrane lipopolysaccharide assembly protein LptE/RlpB
MSLSRRRLLYSLPALVLAGCGFQLRGTKSGNLPYKTMYIAYPKRLTSVSGWSVTSTLPAALKLSVMQSRPMPPSSN